MRDPKPEFDAGVYRRAAAERIKAVHEAYQSNQIVEAYYLAGVAVECILYSYLLRRNRERDDRHDLLQLARRSEFVESFKSETLRDEISADLADVYNRWRNDHRYRSIDSLKNFLNRAKLYRTPEGRTIRGDVAEFQVRIIIEAASRLVQNGVERWETLK